MGYSNRTQLMAIINMSPDSYYSASRIDLTSLCMKIPQLEKEGADIFDVGGESTRPGATPISLEEELSRVIPAIESVHSLTNKPISIDTMKPQVAEMAIKRGATIINDITGFQDPMMHKLLQKYPDTKAVVMHILGNSETMHSHILDPIKASSIVYDFFARKLDFFERKGIDRSRIILDPGIGFSKNLEGNLILMKEIALFKKLGSLLLYGISRKSWIYQLLNRSLDERLPATLAASHYLIERGVDILRVHDVQAHNDIIKTIEAFHR